MKAINKEFQCSILSGGFCTSGSLKEFGLGVFLSCSLDTNVLRGDGPYTEQSECYRFWGSAIINILWIRASLHLHF